MLSQAEADALLAMPKRYLGPDPLAFPAAGEKATYDVESEDSREKFVVDINRGRIRLTKCTYQNRYQAVEVLVRLDLDGPPHENPDGTVIACPHLHLYHEGFGDKWASPIPDGQFANLDDLVQAFVDFLVFCRVDNRPEVQGALL